MSRIAAVDILPLSMPSDGIWPPTPTEETLVVRITDEDGRSGIGECPDAVAAVAAYLDMPTAHQWSQNMRELLIGADPLETSALWERLYQGTLYIGRRGLGIHALSALDVALFDLAAKQIGQPVYKLLGGARHDHVTPYATVFPGIVGERAIATLMAEIGRQFEAALEAGFRAVKMEVMFGDSVRDRALVDLIHEGRAMLGPEISMALDFCYRWRNWLDARWVLERVEECDILFAEAPLQHDDLAGHARLAGVSPIRICGGEFSATRFEAREWIATGHVAVLQPCVSRSGGFTELRRIAEFADLHGVEVIPMGFATGITAAAGIHFQAATVNAPLVEYRAIELYGSRLRRELVHPAQPEIRDGRMALPTAPGLGIELNEELVARYRLT